MNSHVSMLRSHVMTYRILTGTSHIHRNQRTLKIARNHTGSQPPSVSAVESRFAFSHDEHDLHIPSDTFPLTQKADILAAILQLGAKLDVQGAQLDAQGVQLNALGVQVNARGEKLEALGVHVNAQGEKLDALGEKLDALGEKLDAQEVQLGQLMAQQDDIATTTSSSAEMVARIAASSGVVKSMRLTSILDLTSLLEYLNYLIESSRPFPNPLRAFQTRERILRGLSQAVRLLGFLCYQKYKYKAQTGGLRNNTAVFSMINRTVIGNPSHSFCRVSTFPHAGPLEHCHA